MDKYLELLKNLPEDVQEKAKDCKTKEELFKVLKSSGVDLSSLGATVELDDEDLDMVSGGCWESEGGEY